MSALEQRKTGSRWLQVEGGYYVSLKEYVQASPTRLTYKDLHVLFPDHEQQSVEAALWVESKRRRLGGEAIPYGPPMLSERQLARRQQPADTADLLPASSPESSRATPDDENIGIYLAVFLRALAIVPSEESIRLLYPGYPRETIYRARLEELRRRDGGGAVEPLDHDLQDEVPGGIVGIHPVFAPPRSRHERRTEYDLGDDDDEDHEYHGPARRTVEAFVPKDMPQVNDLDDPLSPDELAIVIARLLNHDPVRDPSRRRSVTYRDEVKQALFALVPHYQEKGTASMLVKVAEEVEKHVLHLVQREEPLFNLPPDQAKHGAILSEYLRDEFDPQRL